MSQFSLSPISSSTQESNCKTIGELGMSYDTGFISYPYRVYGTQFAAPRLKLPYGITVVFDHDTLL